MEKQRRAMLEQIPQKDWEKTPPSVKQRDSSGCFVGRLNLINKINA
jgi:hypothetical protein